MNTKYDKFWYFRTEVNEENDDWADNSIMISVDKVTGMLPVSTTELRIYCKPPTFGSSTSWNESRNGHIALTVTAGKMREVMATLVASLNSSARNNPSGVIVVADDSTIDFDDSTRNPIYIHPGITAVTSVIM